MGGPVGGTIIVHDGISSTRERLMRDPLSWRRLRSRSTRISLTGILGLITLVGAVGLGAQEGSQPLGRLSGIVRDSSGTPVEGVEIVLPRVRRLTYSRPDGRFSIDSLPVGTYDVRLRRFGYGPLKRSVAIRNGRTTNEEFSLLPMPQPLPPIVTEVSRGGIGGIVVDTSFTPIPGAEVLVLGAGRRVLADAEGRFYLDVLPGRYMTWVRRMGFAPRSLAVSVGRDAGRQVTVWLQPLAHGLPPVVVEARSGYGDTEAIWQDFGRRLGWSTSAAGSFYTREDIERIGAVWLRELVLSTGMKEAIELIRDGVYGYDCVFVDGRPSGLPVDHWRADEVEAVEVYGPGALNWIPEYAHDFKPAPARRRGVTSFGNITEEPAPRCPALVFVWLRH
jgi:hypothetical protein